MGVGNSQGVEEAASCESRGSMNEYLNPCDPLHPEKAPDVGFSEPMRSMG